MLIYKEYLRDFNAVVAGDKPAMIVEKRKSHDAYHEIQHYIRVNRLSSLDKLLKDSSGVEHPAIIIAAPGNYAAIPSINTLLDSRDLFSREDFQTAMGNLLGYDKESIADYVESDLSLTCGCELCGGSTPQSRLDDEARERRLAKLS